MLKIYFTFCCVLILAAAYSQDKIYYKENKTDDWKVTSIAPDIIKGADPKNAQIAYSTAASKVLFVFNDLGNFLVIPKLFDKLGSDSIIKIFYRKPDNKFNSFDKIITVQNKIIVCTYGKEVDKKIEYMVADKPVQISKSDVAVVIFKNGQHKLVAGADKVYKVLSEVEDLYIDLASASDKPSAADQSLRTQLLTETPRRGDTSSRRQAASNGSLAGMKRDTGAVNSKVPDKTVASGEKKLDSATLLKLQDKAIVNIKQLESYIIIISNKNSEADLVTNSIDQAMALFVNEDVRVEVSSSNTGNVQPYKVKIYLNRLSALNYDKVNIQWYNAQYTSQLRKGMDGNYYGVIEFEQRFTGMSNDKKVYQDITRKTVEIVLKTYKRNVGGESTLEWDVFLGNIGISETKPA